MRRTFICMTGCVSFLILSSCRKGPAAITKQFLNEIHDGNFSGAKTIAGPEVARGIDIIEQDHQAIFKGRKWQFSQIAEHVTGDSARVFYLVSLADHTEIRQSAKLQYQKGGWLISDISNVKVAHADRLIPLYRYNLAPGKGLVTPLDMGYPAKVDLLSHIGQYVTVSGTAADIHLTADPLLVKLSDRHGELLLTAVINGRARDKAIMVYHRYAETDKFVKAPLGKTFTVTGLLRLLPGHPCLEIHTTDDIVIGPFLRADK